MGKKKEYIYLEAEGRKIPLQITRERRRNVRFSVGQKAILVRFPLFLDKNQEQLHFHRLRNWILEHLLKQDGLLDHLAGKDYEHGDEVEVGGRKYRLAIEKEDRKTMSAKLHGKTIHIKIPKTAEQEAINHHMKRLLSKVIGQDFLPEIKERVAQINQKHFQKSIKSVQLKYHTSTWGKCSSSGVISLSTRLLFAPKEVIDYVIIHELAHLEVFGHSREFWELVKKAMPSYKEKERWLKENYYSCSF